VPSFAARAATAYRQIETESRTPLELVVMLYDGVLQHVATARGAVARGDMPAGTRANSRALAIISELQNTLDVERGGEVAQSLDELYRYVSSRLVDASFRRDTAPLDEVTRLLKPLRDAWSTIAQQQASPATRTNP
jgi:flagellar protein FliS